MARKKRIASSDAVRYAPTAENGLTAEEVSRRCAEGLTNQIPKSNAKPMWRILLDNICTFFNLIWAILFAINLYLFIIGVADLGHLFFILVILANTALAIIQEIRAKRTVEKLSLVTAPKIEVIRGGEHLFLASDDLVLDDVIVLSAGNQIPADCVLLDGKTEMNESLLTGESDAVKKAAGDTLFAGSFIISGGCRAKVDRVGTDSYIQTVAKAAKAFKSPKSELFRDINRIIYWIGAAIPPFAALTYWNNYRSLAADFAGMDRIYEALLKTTGTIQGMIPAGMFLLITVALSVGVVKLSFKRTLVKDVYSVEMLSRTNMLCLDKTGTITDGTMRVQADIPLLDGVDIAAAVSGIMTAQDAKNFTSEALLSHYGENRVWEVSYNIPFSSKRKFTATSFAGIGTYAIGAPEFLNVGTLAPEIVEKMDAEARSGRRVLLLAKSDALLSEDALPPMTPAALLVLEDHIRPEAPDTIRWFRENRVGIKIISGDNPVTVASIASRVGVPNADKCISLEGLSDEAVAEAADSYTVFGRVSPEQKHILVKTLKAKGYVVSMTGDGVNDTLALKEADCSIAMADGSEVARSISNIVLLDNNFACLPSVVREGRQVVNNVQRASTLFLMKTLCVIFLSVGCIFFGVASPFESSILTLLEVLVIGIPSVLLAIEPNDSLIEGSFVREVLKRCVPNGLLLLLNSIAVMVMHYTFGVFGGIPAYEATFTFVLALSGFINLLFLCLPLSKLRLGATLFTVVGVAAIMALTPLLPFVGSFFGVAVVNGIVLLVTGILFLVSIPLHIGMTKAWKALLALLDKKKKAKKTA